jgi:hypothetical protein
VPVCWAGANIFRIINYVLVVKELKGAISTAEIFEL